jgi:hypothetical protein
MPAQRRPAGGRARGRVPSVVGSADVNTTDVIAVGDGTAGNTTDVIQVDSNNDLILVGQ